MTTSIGFISELYEPLLKFKMNKRGVTLVELLIAVVISTIALLGAMMPFMVERLFWTSGNRQLEAQRDAQMVMRAMAAVGREANSYTLTSSSGQMKIAFTFPPSLSCSGGAYFEGGPSYNGGRLDLSDCAGSNVILIDGVRSKVTQLVVTSVTTRLVNLQLQITHQNQEHESLQTTLLLRNAS